MISNNTYLSGLASHLVFEGLLDKQIVDEACYKAKLLDIHFVSYITQNNLIDSQLMMASCIKTFNLPMFDLALYDPNWINNLPLSADFFKRYHAVPLYKTDNVIHLGISDPTDRSALDAAIFHTGTKVQPVIVDENLLSEILNKYFNNELSKNSLELSIVNKITQDEQHYIIQETTVNYDEPLIQFADNLIQHAIHQSASDIHIEPYEKICRIRYRLDGILHEIAEIPTQLASRLIVRLKIMSKIDISERRIPQDGRFQVLDRDIRINTCPTLFGEKVVLRLLNPKHINLEFNSLGLTDNQAQTILHYISKPQGLILVTGPTGSGKTITLYTALNHLNSPDKNISTVEDPIEIQLPGINQVNVQPKIGLDFASVLRSFLRQDPDIIMVGEIRDLETAEIAIQAAQTGHLVFSTLHTNSTIDTITRLRSIGVASYNIANSISLIIAQRLIRKLCSHCKQPEYIPSESLISLGFELSLLQHMFFRAIGCMHCTNGYSGRTAIYEILPITSNINELILDNTSSIKLLHYAKSNGFISLKQSGIQKVIDGTTSIMELNRVISS